MPLIKTLAGQFAKIKVMGIGGAGNNAINSMIEEDIIHGVDFIAVNTDSQALLNSKAMVKLQIGEKLTKGLGAGGNPKIGEDAAQESQERIKELLEGTNLLFITGGMGGGTCTGAAPVIAQIAKKELGILTIAVVTKPFLFEGARRLANAEEGISLLKDKVDTLIVIPNQKVMEVIDNQATLLEAFKVADSILNKGTRAIADLITVPGLINLDFADIKSIMSDAGSALMGVGEAEGENRVTAAVEAAINSPLIEVNIDGARGVLINITGGPDLTMTEVETAAKAITARTSPDANIVFGYTIDSNLKGKMKITVIATGFDTNTQRIYRNSTPTTNQSSLGINQETIDKYLGNQEIPKGIDINDEFDIPAFLRKVK